MSQRPASPRRTSLSPRRGRSPVRTSSGQLNAHLRSADSSLVRFSSYVVPVLSAIAALFLATLLLRSYVLMVAAKNAPSLVPVFLKLGANPRAQDRLGGSPLHALCASSTPSEHAYLCAALSCVR